MQAGGGEVKITEENTVLNIPKKFAPIELRRFKLDFLKMVSENPPKVD